MPNVGANATVNKVTQIIPEATPGTILPATKIIDSMDIMIAPQLNTKQYRNSGRKYPYATAPGREWTDLTGTGTLDYEHLAYWLSGLDQITPALHPLGTLSQDWIKQSQMGGAAGSSPQTYSIEKGDSQHASKFAYGVISELHWKQDTNAIDAGLKGIAQQIQDAITMNAAGVTHVKSSPIYPGHWNYYLDTTPANLGTTQITDLLNVSGMIGGLYAPAFYINRAANNSYGKHVETPPAVTIDMEMEADNVGMSPLAYIRAGQTVYVSAQAQGPIIEGAIRYAFRVDMVAKVSKIKAFADDAGIYKIGWTFTAHEDNGAGSLGYAWKVTATNTMTTL